MSMAFTEKGERKVKHDEPGRMKVEYFGIWCTWTTMLPLLSVFKKIQNLILLYFQKL
jgi:hypothetical protein